MSYRFLDHTADIALEVYGSCYEELFESSAIGWREAVINLSVDGDEERRFYINENTPEELLVRFLDEMNYLLYSKRWIFDSIKTINIIGKNGQWQLDCLLTGAYFSDPSLIKEEIKAVTFHQMSIQKVNNEFTTRIIFDI